MDNEGFNQDPEKGGGTELKLVDKKKVKLVLGKESQTDQDPAEDHSHHRKDHKESGKSSDEKSGGGGSGAGGSSGGGGSSNGANKAAAGAPSTSTCRPEVCQAARSRFTPPDLRGSPWHRNKTIFLLVILGSLIVWFVIYCILSKLDLV